MDDETRRQSAERARLDAIVAGMRAGTWEWNVQTGEVVFNERWAEIVGRTLAELSPLSIKVWEALAHPDDLGRSGDLLARHFAGELPYYECDARMRHKDGSWVWVRDRGKVGTWTADGKPEWMFGTHVDVTAQKRAYERVHRMERLLAEGQAIAHLGTFEYVAATQTTVWSEEEYRIYGLDPTGPSPTYDRMLATCIHPDDAALLHETFSRAMETRGIYALEHRVVRPDGSVRWVIDRAHPHLGPDGSIARYVGTTLDITERKLADERQRESEARYRALFENMTAGFVLFEVVQDEHGAPMDLVILAGNKGFEATTGLRLAEVAGKRLTHALPGIQQDAADWIGTYGRVALTGEPREFEQRSETLGSSYAVSAYQAAPKQCAVTFTNITARKQAQATEEKLRAQLILAQRIESVGRLAGGVAHDFNNMLSVILGHAELALEKVGPSQALFGDLQEIRQAATRSADLTRQLLAFARQQNIAPRVLDLNETVEGMLKLLRRLIGEDVDLVWKPGRHARRVRMDPSQVDQVLANLCVNARDAIEGVGRIVIETTSVVFDDAYCAEHVGVTPGEYVLLAVSDNGCGMDRDTRSRIFEPFFTTKGLGQGTGLGLATVYGIVKQNDGFINVYSEPGDGTTFKIYLPAHLAHPVAACEPGSDRVALRGDETVLLVEDEPAHLALTTQVLAGLGYTVLPAATPGEAIRVAAEHRNAIHLLVTDVVMPEMNGRQLASVIAVHCPAIRCLFMSGYTANVIAHRGVLEDGVHFLQKPFSRVDLAAKVRETLTAPRA